MNCQSSKRHLLLYFFLSLITVHGQHQSFDWVKIFNGSGDGSQVIDIANDTQGNYLIAGSFNQKLDTDGFLFHSAGLSDAFLAKADSTGNIKWIKHFPGSGEQNLFIETDSLDNYYIMGYFEHDVIVEGQTFTLTDPSFASATFMAKFDSNGTILWRKLLGPYVQVDGRFGFSANKSGTFALAGIYIGTVDFGGITITPPDNFNNIFVASFSPDGAPNWVKTPTGHIQSFDIPPNTIAVGHIDKYDNVYCSGIFVGDIVLDAIALTGEAGSYNVFVSKIDSNGEFQKAHLGKLGAHGPVNGGIPFFGDGATDKFGNYYLNLTYYSKFQMGDYNFIENLDLPGAIVFFGDIAVLKFNAQFELEWAKTLGSKGSEYGMLSVTKRNTVIISGSGSDILTGICPELGGLFGIEINAEGDIIHVVRLGKTWYGTYNFSTVDNKDRILISGIIGTLIDYNSANNLESNIVNSGFWGRYTLTTFKLAQGNVVSDKPACIDSNLLFTCANIPNSTIYEWELISGNNLQIFETRNEVLVLPASTFVNLQEISVRVRGKNNCLTGDFSDYKLFSFNLPVSGVIPNVITPNNDFFNNRFILPDGLEGSELEIFNRWGQNVYTTKHYDNNWSAENLSDGVYFFNAKNKCSTQPIRGYISVIR
jgi:CHU_C Type IX secretion signal domain